MEAASNLPSGSSVPPLIWVWSLSANVND